MRTVYIPDGYKDNLQARCKFWLDTGETFVFSDEELETLRVFLQVDQSGAEALIVAYDSTAGDYRQLFIHSVKPHVYVAMKLFQELWAGKAKEHGLKLDATDIDILCYTPIARLRANPNFRELDLLIKSSDNWPLTQRYYYLAKQTVHSGNYDIQRAMFQMNILEKSGGKINISLDDAGIFLEMYRGIFPEIPERNRRVRQQVDKTGVLYNLHGHPYTITNYNITEVTYKEFYAWCPQSTVGEITRIAFTRLQQFIEQERKRWDILADTHDSYLLQCPIQDVQEASNKMQEFMNQKLVSHVDGTEFYMKSECQAGFNWSPYKPSKNDLGLRELKWLQ